MSNTPALPLLLSLLAAALFGAQAVLARRSLRHVNAQTGSMITIVTASLLFWSLSLWRMEAEFWRSPALWVFLSNGLLHPLISMFLSFEANRRMGATTSAAIAASTPLFAALGAVVGLGEAATVEIVLGTLGIMAGGVVLSWSSGGRRSWPLYALAFPVGASLVRAFNHVWGRFGMLLLPAPLFAATLSFTVSGSLSVLAHRVRNRGRPLRIPREGLLWGAVSGVTVAAAILCMYTALARGNVVVVSPLMNSYPLFTLLWSLLFRQEVLSARILVGVVLVVGGVTLIGLR